MCVCVCVCLFVPSRHSGAVKAGVPAERDSCASLVSITSETPKSAICIDREQPHVTGCHKPLRKKTAVYFVATQKRCGEMDFTFYTWQSERERERESERVQVEGGMVQHTSHLARAHEESMMLTANGGNY